MENLPDLDSYDTIFIGAPVWAGSVPDPMISFLKNTDFKGKIVVPYATHRGNVGKFHSIFRENVENAKILKEMDFYKVKKTAGHTLENMISDWLNSLGN
jgi:flavodoxin